MKFRSRTKETISVNLTPLIDVVFLLLIFFMLSSTFEHSTNIKVELPGIKEQHQESATNAIEVWVYANGEIGIDDQIFSFEETAELTTALKQKVGGANLQVPMVILGDKLAPHQAIMRVMDTAGQMGIENIQLRAVAQS